MLSLFKHSFTSFRELKAARKLNFGNVVGYVLILALLMSLPIAFKTYQVFRTIQKDGTVIAEKIPDFTIEDNQLKASPESEGFIYQTDTIVFTFDPAGKRSPSDISADMVGNLFSVGLLKDRIVFATPDSTVTNAVLGGNQLEIPYDEPAVQNLTGQHLRNFLEKNQVPWWLPLLIVFVALFPTFLNLIMTLVLTTLLANITIRMRRLSLSFLDNLKIISFAATLPILISIILQLIWPNYDPTFFIMIGTLFIYFRAIRDLLPSKPQ